MKIIYLVDFLRTVHAGTEGQLAYLLRALPTLGHKVELVSLQESPYLADEAPRCFPEVSFRVLHGSSELSSSMPAFVKLYSFFREERPDIVHTFFPAANSLGVLVARMAGVRAIVGSRRDMGYALSAKELFLLRLADRFVSRIIVNSFAIRERVVETERVVPVKIEVIFNGVPRLNSCNPHCPAGSDPPVVGIVANLNREIKRIDVFLRAAVGVLAHVPEAEFWVIGDGHLRPQLEGLAGELGISPRVRFMGRRSDVSALLPRLSVGVISSDSEGLSNAILEYMAHGLPVVATAVGGNPELVQENFNGFLVPPGEPEGMASAIVKALQNPKMSSEFGARGKARIARDFGVERMVEETCRIYASLLEPHAVNEDARDHVA